MVKLGWISRKKEKLNFREWVESGRMKEGIYRVRILFPPSKFPSFSFIFETNDTEVKLTIGVEKLKQALDVMGIRLGKRDLPALVIVIDEEGYGIDIDKDTKQLLVWKGSYWKLEKKDEEKEDIPF